MNKWHLPEISPATYDQIKQLLTVGMDYANQAIAYVNTHVHPLAGWALAVIVLLGMLWLLAKLFLFVVRMAFFVVLPGIALAVVAMTFTPYPFQALFTASAAIFAVIDFVRR